MTKIIKKAVKKNKKFFSEFKEFAMKSNVVELAVGVIIGTAFGKIVTSLVQDILMPIIGILLGGINLSTLSVNVFDKVTLNYGIFLQNSIDFLIIAFSVFVFVKVVTSISKLTEKKKEEPKKKEEEKKPDDILLLEEIRDLLKEKQDN